MYLKRLAVVALLSGILTAYATPSVATVITWDFRLGSSTPSTSTELGFGNNFTFTAGGVTVTVTAWGLTGSLNTFQTAEVGRWATGLGSCNRQEGTSGSGCSSPVTQVDNFGPDDFVLFKFSSPVDPTKIVIDPSGTWDRDVSYWVGNTAGNLNGIGLAGLWGVGFGSRRDVSNSSSDSSKSFALTSGYVNSLLFGANAVTDQDDRFMIRSLTAATPTPEPGTLLLLGSGVVGVGIFGRRFRGRR